MGIVDVVVIVVGMVIGVILFVSCGFVGLVIVECIVVVLVRIGFGLMSGVVGF